MKFTQVKDFLYVLEDPQELILKAKNYIDLISDNKTHLYVIDCNDILLCNIISRLVSLEFFKEHKIENDTLAVLIEFTYNGISYNVSLASLPDPNDPEVIKRVESIYIK